MRYIVNNNVTEAVGGSTNTNFPALNILDIHPRKVWKSTLYIDTVTVTVSELFNTITIFNTNAQYADVTITDMDDNVIWATRTFDFTGILSLEQFMTGDGDTITRVFIPVGELIAAESKVIIEFSKLDDGSPIYCGIVWAGLASTINNPSYPLTEGIVDYSIVQELNNGATYIKERDRVRKYSFNISTSDLEAERLYLDVLNNIGPNPMPFELVCGSGALYTLFGRLESMPKVVQQSYGRANISLNILEVL